MALQSLNDFTSFISWPYVIAYLVQVNLKYVYIFFRLLSSAYTPETKATCTCCNLYLKFESFLVKSLLGLKEAVVGRFPTYKKDIVDKTDVPVLYIRNYKLSHFDVSMLALSIYIFGMLAGLSAWQIYFIEQSRICSDDVSISCFPVAKHPDAEEILNISTDMRITNCSFWNSENVSDLVDFRCFRWALNTNGVVAQVGGLLTIFILTMRIALAASLTFMDFICDKYIGKRVGKCDAIEINKGEEEKPQSQGQSNQQQLKQKLKHLQKQLDFVRTKQKCYKNLLNFEDGLQCSQQCLKTQLLSPYCF